MARKEGLDPYSSLSKIANLSYLDPISYGLYIWVLKDHEKLCSRIDDQVALKIKDFGKKILISSHFRPIINFKKFLQ